MASYCIPAHRGSVLSLTSTVVGGAPLLCSGGHDGKVRMWRRTAAGTLAPAGALAPGAGSIFSLSAHACTDGSAILAAGTFSRILHAWRVAATEAGETRVVETLLSSREHTGWVRATAVADEHSCCSIGCNRLLAWRLPGGPPPDLPERELPLYEDATAADQAAQRSAPSPLASPSPSPSPSPSLQPYTQPETKQAAQRSHDILSIGWSDGVLAAGSVDGALRCWRADVVGDVAGGAATGPAALLGRRPAHWMGHADRVAAVALSAEGALPALFNTPREGVARSRLAEPACAKDLDVRSFHPGQARSCRRATIACCARGAPPSAPTWAPPGSSPARRACRAEGRLRSPWAARACGRRAERGREGRLAAAAALAALASCPGALPAPGPRCARGTRRRALQRPVAGCGAAVRPGRSRGRSRRSRP